VGRAVAVLAAGSSLAGFGFAGRAGAATNTSSAFPDVSPIFECVSCGVVSSAQPATPKNPPKESGHDADKRAKEADKRAAKHGAKDGAMDGGDLEQFLGNSTVIDPGGRRWS
jgi:hypothetical protein